MVKSPFFILFALLLTTGCVTSSEVDRSARTPTALPPPAPIPRTIDRSQNAPAPVTRIPSRPLPRRQNSPAPAAPKTTPAPPSENPFPEVVLTTGPIDDCLMQTELYARKEGLESQCTLNYVHFFPSKVKKIKAPPSIRIGSFNLFHLGDTVAPMKNLALMAQIINQWDIVGVQELMPLVAKWRISNRGVYQILLGGVNLPEVFSRDWAVVSPGYIKLLKELRQIDPSWSLIMQPKPDGEGSTGEMAGFFYRSQFVQLKDWNYCPSQRSLDIKTQKQIGNLACLVQVPVPQRPLISRTAFAAYFEVGKFNFVGLSTHVRFNKAMKAKDRTEQEKQVCSQHENPKSCSLAQDEVGRYYEVKVVADQIAQLQKAANDKDIIYMGDYNLEMNDKSAPLWQASLLNSQGHDVFQSELSTLSIPKDALASNYDHFVFNPADTGECDINSIHTMNYTKVLDKIQDNEVMLAIAESLKDENKQKVFEKLEAEINLLIRQKGSSIVQVTEKERAELIKKNERALARMKQNTTGALLEFLSDHLPIEITCFPGKSVD